MSLELFLLLGAALFAIGLYGALSQQSIVMAVGFAVVTAIFRARDVDMTDMAADLKE